MSSDQLRRSILLTLSLLSACAAAQVTDGTTPMTAGLDRIGITGAPGAYVAGRFAVSQGDLNAASDMLLRGLEVDPTNAFIEEQAFLATMLAGRPEAVTIAAKLPGNLAAQLLLANQDVRDGRWSSAQDRYAALTREGPVQLLQPLLVAWAQFGGGHVDSAIVTLRPLVEGPNFRAAYALHAGVIADLSGQMEEAGRDYRIAQAGYGVGNIQVARIVASFQARQNHLPEAQQTLSALADASPEFAIALPALYSKSAQLQIRDARDGLAESYLALAGALRAPETNELAMVLLRLSIDLRPELTVARMLTADMLTDAKHPEAALAMLAPVASDDPLLPVVQIRRVNLLRAKDQDDKALALLDEMVRAYPDRPEPATMRGDLLRSKNKFREAVTAYDQAVALVAKPTRANWPLFYERGIALERSQQWAKAEADFLHALELSPDEPFVLNYLGYSWTEQGLNLPKARQMVERAVEQRPNDGAIVDSLGWVALRQGDKPGAVKLLQRAVELSSSDATINGHLGDAYAAVGRTLEAQFQWRRALSLGPESEDIPKLEAKLRDSEQAPVAVIKTTP